MESGDADSRDDSVEPSKATEDGILGAGRHAEGTRRARHPSVVDTGRSE